MSLKGGRSTGVEGWECKETFSGDLNSCNQRGASNPAHGMKPFHHFNEARSLDVAGREEPRSSLIRTAATATIAPSTTVAAASTAVAKTAGPRVRGRPIAVERAVRLAMVVMGGMRVIRVAVDEGRAGVAGKENAGVMNAWIPGCPGQLLPARIDPQQDHACDEKDKQSFHMFDIKKLRDALMFVDPFQMTIPSHSAQV